VGVEEVDELSETGESIHFISDVSS
jgi:hypothetical protein